MPKFLITVFVALFLIGCQKAPEPAPAGLAIRCGALIDGIGDEALGGRLIIVRDERIAAVEAIGEIPDGMELLDLSEYTCLPGLIDTHTHIALNHDDSSDLTIYYRRPMTKTMDITVANAATTLQAGFTTIRNVGDYFPEAIIEARDSIRAGDIQAYLVDEHAFVKESSKGIAFRRSVTTLGFDQYLDLAASRFDPCQVVALQVTLAGIIRVHE